MALPRPADQSATPRIKDFRGLNGKAFDRRGSYSIGLNEQGVFPEIDMAERDVHARDEHQCVLQQLEPEMSRHVLG